MGDIANLERFPGDFMFQLSKEEAELSRSQFATLNDDPDNLKSQIAAIENEGDGLSFSRSER